MRMVLLLVMLLTGSCTSLATSGWQTVFKRRDEKLIQRSEAGGALPRLVRRSSRAGAAGSTGRTTCHAATYTSKTEQTAEAVVTRVEQVVSIHHAQETCPVSVLRAHPVSHLLHVLRPHIRCIRLRVLSHQATSSHPVESMSK